MCGIAGYYGEEIIPNERIDACLGLMRRRGPDSASYKHWKTPGPNPQNAYLLHSRLSIIDLDPRANQPLNVAKKWIIFNGELYNYLELKTALISDGQTLKTTSDTEVLLKAIGYYGLDVLDKCEGMWAFAVYDAEDGSLVLSRDRFGEKPFYIYKTKKGLYFGSEPKFIFALSGRRLDINYDQVYRYWVNGYKSLYKQGETFFQGLQELPPASVLKIQGNKKEQRSYWKPVFSPDENMTYKEAVEGAREHLIQSVKLRLRADVPLAFCMSGGVDSNSLISIAKRIFNYDVHGFTIVNTDSRYDERELVEGSVKELGIRHTAIPVDTKDFLSKLKMLVSYHDSPVCTITYYAHWLLQESIAKHGYRISVSGTAADELFTGYYDHHLFYLHELHNSNLEQYALAKQAWEKNIYPVVRNPYLKDPKFIVSNPSFRDHIYLNADKFKEYLRKDWSETFSEEKFCDSVLRNRTLNEMFHEAVPVILHEDDLNAMYFSIENRSPFLDRNLFEFCYKIPVQHLIKNGSAKAVLRDAMRGIVPDTILDNSRKIGFNAPIFSFLDVKNPNVRDVLIDDSPIFDHVDRKKIEELISKADLPNSESKFLFYFISSKLFIEEFSS